MNKQNTQSGGEVCEHNFMFDTKTGYIDEMPYYDCREVIYHCVKCGKVVKQAVSDIENLQSRNAVIGDAAIENETKVKLLASINSFLAEQGIKDTDGTPLTFSPERF